MLGFLSYISQYIFLFILHIAHSESFPKPLKKSEEQHYLELAAKGDIGDTLRLFCRELTKARAQNVALMIDGDDKAAARLKEILTEAGTNVIDEVLYVKGGLPIIGGSVKPEEKTAIMAWVDRVIANLK